MDQVKCAIYLAILSSYTDSLSMSNWKGRKVDKTLSANEPKCFGVPI